VLLVGLADYVSDARLSVLFVIPVALATWPCGRRAGVMIALLATMTWAMLFTMQSTHPADAFLWWDSFVLACTLLLFVELLARLHVALDRSDERFVRVLRGLHAAVFVSDDEGHVLFANEWLMRLMGHREALTADEIARRFPIAVRGTQGIPDTPANRPFTGAEVRDTIDGHWYLAQAGAINWIDGRRVRLTVLTDVTEQKHMAALQREHQAALHHTARLVNLAEAGTTLAHELNQPLLAIVGYNAACLRLLESGKGTKDDLVGAMEKCRVQAVRAGDILHRIRDLTRKRAITLVPCDFNGMLREVLAWVQEDLDRHGVRVERMLAQSLPEVQADRILVEQVMLNLVNNAIDAMQPVPRKQRRLTVETTLDTHGAVRVTVADRGSGIAPENQTRLFTPFFTTKERGLGLGLSICRSVVEMHGGRLWHEAREGGGTAFHFTLPRGTPT
jgi:C4-dicarboxylate-specific signal transduction histidine kinase